MLPWPEWILVPKVLAVPIGRDAVVWNAHRIYGRIRLPLLFEGWDVVDSFGFNEKQFKETLGRWDVQPVWVFRPFASAG